MIFPVSKKKKWYFCVCVCVNEVLSTKIKQLKKLTKNE